MERTQILIQPETIARTCDSADRLGASLAKGQLARVEHSYQQRYERGINCFWKSQIYISEEVGSELASLKLEAQRQFAIKVARVVLLMGVPCGLIGWWGLGAAVGVILFVCSVFAGIYLGSK